MMPSILQQIVSRRREEISKHGHSQGLSLPTERDVPLVPFCTTETIICEVKHHSPSRGVLVENFDPLKQASEYKKYGANTLSVLTEQHYFKAH